MVRKWQITTVVKVTPTLGRSPEMAGKRKCIGKGRRSKSRIGRKLKNENDARRKIPSILSMHSPILQPQQASLDSAVWHTYIASYSNCMVAFKISNTHTYI